ncbi:Bacterial regulatory protein, tetR family [Mycobacteroides salmoniphilum]|uniref:Bacterial regulatory protein, tetR family n=2 Tax=Mycobacteroides salmoniphilum TaxID=404941 RepID=A0A4R8SXN6_9MYCO|nr:Bacterial regulatory protein, tetR family [Mycobacteroides salmoniphilum]
MWLNLVVDMVTDRQGSVASQRDSHEGDSTRQGRPRSEASRVAILQATLALIEEVGIKALTIEAVAHRAKVGKSTVYRWWPSQAVLIIEAMDQIQYPELPDTGDIVTDLVELGIFMRDSVFGSVVGTILLHLRSDLAALDPSVSEYVAGRMIWPTVVIDRAVARGELDGSVDPLLLLGMASGPVLAHVLLGAPAPTNEALERAARIAIAPYVQRIEQS